jgi:hypothetical protein
MVTQKDLYQRCIKDVPPTKVKPKDKPQGRFEIEVKGEFLVINFRVPKKLIEDLLDKYKDGDNLV